MYIKNTLSALHMNAKLEPSKVGKSYIGISHFRSLGSVIADEPYDRP